MRQLGVLPVQEGCGQSWARRRLQGWKTSTDLAYSYTNCKASFALPWTSLRAASLPSSFVLCGILSLLPTCSLCLATDSEAPSPQLPALQTQWFPKGSFLDLENFPSPLESWFPAHVQPAGSTAVSHCNEATDAVSPHTFAIAALKLNVFTLVLPSKAVPSASLSIWPHPEQHLGQSSQQPDILGVHTPPICHSTAQVAMMWHRIKPSAFPLEGYSPSARWFACSNCFNAHLHER